MAQNMSEIMNPGAAVPEPGFPHAPADWSRAAAERQAAGEGLTLGADHWETIQALQGYFMTHDQPRARALHDALDESFHSRGGIKYLYTLFPGGPLAQGCRLAGLQPPAGALDPSFGSVQ